MRRLSGHRAIKRSLPVSGNGLVTGTGGGTARIDASAEGITGSVTVTVIAVPIVSVTVTLSISPVNVGQNGQATAVLKDGQGNTVSGRAITWSSSDTTVARVTVSGQYTGKKAGATTISATVEGKQGTAQLAVNDLSANCTGSITLSLNPGDIQTLSSAQKSLFCISSPAASEYVVIPFNNSSVATTTVPLQFFGSNTVAPAALLADVRSAALQTTSGTSFSGVGSSSAGSSNASSSNASNANELEFRQREYADLKPVMATFNRATLRLQKNITPSRITGVPATPAVGDVYPINTNLLGNTCFDPKQLHPTRVIAVLPHVIVLADTLAPPGGYTNNEMAAFGQQFEAIGYGLDTLNFGAPSDLDNNGRVAVVFTQGVNVIPVSPGTVILGLQAGRDLFPLGSCVGSNEGEMFYLPVVDVNHTINNNYTNKATLANGVQGTLVHEFQHLINAGRRLYVNNAPAFEDVWLNEGLSHIAEELLYYQVSGNAPRTNINLDVARSSQAQLDAINAYQVQNLGRLRTYMLAPETHSPYAQNDLLETRGATWQLLRYSADRNGGNDAAVWRALVNTTLSGRENFNAVFGDIVTFTRDWAVAQYADDLGFGVAANYMNPSWNFRSLMPAINGNIFPLLTHVIGIDPVDISLSGGAAAYLRFQIGAASGPGAVSLKTVGQPLPARVDVMVMRTK
jgi:Bacterial surface proteins containing Ig-like domains